MDAKDKQFSKYRLGLAIQKILSGNKATDDENVVKSLRKLAASSGTEYAIIQKIASAKKDPQFTTVMALLDGFEITLTEFATVYDSLSEPEVLYFKKELDKKRMEKEKKTKAKKKDSKK